MGRVIDDIVQYFKQRDVDIMSKSDCYGLVIDHEAGIVDALRNRERPTADLIRSVIESEQISRAWEEEARKLRRERKALHDACVTVRNDCTAILVGDDVSGMSDDELFGAIRGTVVSALQKARSRT